MNTNLQKATAILAEGEYTCVLCLGTAVHTSALRGVKPLLDWLDSGEDLRGFCAADRIVGNAAAFLYVLLGVSAVYADVMSEKAKQTLESHGIEAVCALEVSGIINRINTGPCPMEQAVSGISDPDAALAAIKSKLIELNERRY